MEKIKVGIIGTGGIGHFHARGYQKLKDVEIEAVCDLDLKKAEEFAKEYNVPHVFQDYHEMLSKADVDAVSVTTWNNGHAPISIAALKANKQVLCEKPLAMDAKEAKEMVDIAKETCNLLMVGFVRRFEEKVNLLKESIDKGELGELYYAKTGYMRKWGNPGGWFSDKKRSGGGPVIDLGVHVIDLIRYFAGKPKAVSVSGDVFNKLGTKNNIKGFNANILGVKQQKDLANDVEDAATALIKFDNLTLFFETSWVINIKENNNYLYLYGDKGGAQLEPDLEIYEERNNYFTEVKPKIDHKLDAFQNIFNREMAHFIDCVANGVECINPAEDGLKVMKIIDAIYKSAEEGREVIIK